MGRKIRTDIPQVKSHLIPNWEYARQFRTLDQNYKRGQKDNYDKRHGVKILPQLPENQAVWIEHRGQSGQPIPGQISHVAATPLSYIVETPSGDLRRNHSHVRTPTI